MCLVTLAAQFFEFSMQYTSLNLYNTLYIEMSKVPDSWQKVMQEQGKCYFNKSLVKRLFRMLKRGGFFLIIYTSSIMANLVSFL